MVEFNTYQKLGSRMYLGCEYMYFFQKKMSFLGYLAKFKRSAFETYYANYQDAQGLLSFGGIFKINKRMTMATEVEFSDFDSNATIGLQKKYGNYMLNSSINTNGVIKSNFNIKKGLLKLKLYLTAKMKEEDFTTGIQLSINPMEMM